MSNFQGPLFFERSRWDISVTVFHRLQLGGCWVAAAANLSNHSANPGNPEQQRALRQRRNPCASRHSEIEVECRKACWLSSKAGKTQLSSSWRCFRAAKSSYICAAVWFTMSKASSPRSWPKHDWNICHFVYHLKYLSLWFGFHSSLPWSSALGIWVCPSNSVTVHIFLATEMMEKKTCMKTCSQRIIWSLDKSRDHRWLSDIGCHWVRVSVKCRLSVATLRSCRRWHFPVLLRYGFWDSSLKPRCIASGSCEKKVSKFWLREQESKHILSKFYTNPFKSFKMFKRFGFLSTDSRSS